LFLSGVRKLRCRIVLVIGVIAVAVGMRIKMRGDHSRISGWQRREVSGREILLSLPIVIGITPAS